MSASDRLKTVAADAAAAAARKAAPSAPSPAVPVDAGVPATPSVPSAADLPSVPDGPGVPSAPSVPSVAELASVPGGAGVPETPAVPDALPSVPGGANLPTAPSAPAAPGAPAISAPKALGLSGPGAPSVGPPGPGAPSVPSVGSLPSVVAAAVPAALSTAAALDPVGLSGLSTRIADAGNVLRSVFGSGSEPLPNVRYAFTSEDTIAWAVARVVLREQLSEAYELHLDLLTDDVDADTDALLGQSCILDIDREAHRRSVHGIVTELELIALARGQLHVRVRIVPAIELLDQRIASRAYQDVAVNHILGVLEPFLAPYERTVRFELDEKYERRDYCVQFRESDFRFHKRLMQEEGIAFYFDNSDDEAKEVVVIVDNNRKFPKFSDDPIPFIANDEALADEESIQTFQSRTSLRPTAFARRDFDHRTPKEPIDHREEIESKQFREVYEHTERRYIHHDGAALAKRRFEQIRMDAKVMVGRSNVTGLSVGHVFELEGHPRPELDGRYLVIEIDHFGDASEVTLDTVTSGRDADYRNEFRCIPADVPYRPALTVPQPKLHGDLTGTVCGPDRSEVHTDPEGRIKVAMHWDHEGTRNQDASCWMRVRHAWAGLEYGAFCLPRVGMEVLVSFLDGNPDRPLVTGCVYNGDNPPPLKLPEEKTKTTFRTSSSPGGDGFNELRIEDAAGCEEIYVHAQKDFNATVKDACSWSVGGGRSVSVGGSNSVSITGKHSMFVDKDASVTTNGHYSLDSDKTIKITAKSSITLTVGKSSIHITPDLIKAIADAKAWWQLDANARIQSEKGSFVLLTDNAGMVANAGGFVAMTSDVRMQAKDNANVYLSANAAVSGKQVDCVSTDGASLVLTADAVLEGGTTTCAAKGGGFAQLEKSGATLAGKTTTVAGDSEVKISGALINIG